MTKQIKKVLTKGIGLLTIAVLALPASMVSMFLISIQPAMAQDLCHADVDVVLIMDISGSMQDGANLSQCDWWNLEQKGPSLQWVLHTDDDVTEQWCNDKDQSPSRPSVFTPATDSKIVGAKAAASSFVDDLETQDQSALVSFSDTAQIEKQLSNDHTATQIAINNLTTGGATNIGDAIAEGIVELSSERANPQAAKAMILLTDGKANRPIGPGYGEDPEDVVYALAKAGEAATAGFKLFTIGLGSNSDINEDMLEDIADMTGGSYHHANNGHNLDEIYDQIAWEVCQYGSISGCKYIDLNNDGDISGEETASGWEIVLSGDFSDSQSTDQDGCYTFAGLELGNYTVVEGANTDKEPFIQTYPQGDSYQLYLNKGYNEENVDFGNYFPVCGNDIIDEGEDCDGGEGCTPECTLSEPVCGNSVVESPEECDDGNQIDDDECSNQCIENVPECTEPTSVVINEIMQNPHVVGDGEGEWFEFYNASSTPFDLEGCVIRDNDGDSHIIENSLIINGFGYLVLAKNGTSTENGGVLADYVYSSFILANSDDEVVLECCQTEIDKVEYDGGSQFPNPKGVSMLLINPFLDNNLGGSWCTSTSFFGDGDLGTPGALNDTCGQAPECGNSIPEPPEECDDGNQIDDDECSNQCTINESGPECGDGVVDEGEQCDDSNTDNGDGCNSQCMIELTACPEPTLPILSLLNLTSVDVFERTGAAVDLIFGKTDPILTADIAEAVGNADFATNAAEYYDVYVSDADGTLNPDGSYLTFDCFRNNFLENSLVGNNIDAAGLHLSDASLIYADRVTNVELGYGLSGLHFTSNGFAANSLAAPDLVSTKIGDQYSSLTVGFCDFLSYQPECGNSIPEPPEQCDDGNTTDGDGCSALCQTEGMPEPDPVCGNNEVEQGEQCDDGNTTDGDGCSSTCQLEQEPEPEPEPEDNGKGVAVNNPTFGNPSPPAPEPVCGDGVIDEGEQCDDSNIEDEDGCSSICQIEETIEPQESVGPSATSTEPTATTTEETNGQEQTLPEQCDYLTSYLRFGQDNPRNEMLKLQQFLRDIEGYDLELTTLFDLATLEAVKDFQLRYANDILDPWGIDFATGYVYLTTTQKINEIYCQRAFPLTKEQRDEIARIRVLIEETIEEIEKLTGEEVGQTELEEELPIGEIIGQEGTDEDEFLANVGAPVAEQPPPSVELRSGVISFFEDIIASVILFVE